MREPIRIKDHNAGGREHCYDANSWEDLNTLENNYIYPPEIDDSMRAYLRRKRATTLAGQPGTSGSSDRKLRVHTATPPEDCFPCRGSTIGQLPAEASLRVISGYQRQCIDLRNTHQWETIANGILGNDDREVAALGRVLENLAQTDEKVSSYITSQRDKWRIYNEQQQQQQRQGSTQETPALITRPPPGQRVYLESVVPVQVVNDVNELTLPGRPLEYDAFSNQRGYLTQPCGPEDKDLEIDVATGAVLRVRALPNPRSDDWQLQCYALSNIADYVSKRGNDLYKHENPRDKLSFTQPQLNSISDLAIEFKEPGWTADRAGTLRADKKAGIDPMTERLMSINTPAYREGRRALLLPYIHAAFATGGRGGGGATRSSQSSIQALENILRSQFDCKQLDPTADIVDVFRTYGPAAHQWLIRDSRVIQDYRKCIFDLLSVLKATNPSEFESTVQGLLNPNVISPAIVDFEMLRRHPISKDAIAIQERLAEQR